MLLAECCIRMTHCKKKSRIPGHSDTDQRIQAKYCYANDHIGWSSPIIQGKSSSCESNQGWRLLALKRNSLCSSSCRSCSYSSRRKSWIISPSLREQQICFLPKRYIANCLLKKSNQTLSGFFNSFPLIKKTSMKQPREPERSFERANKHPSL